MAERWWLAMNYTCFYCGRAITSNGEEAADPGPDRPSEPLCSHCERRVSGGASISGRSKRSDDENNLSKAVAASAVGYMRTRQHGGRTYLGGGFAPHISFPIYDGEAPRIPRDQMGRKRARLPRDA